MTQGGHVVALDAERPPSPETGTGHGPSDPSPKAHGYAAGDTSVISVEGFTNMLKFAMAAPHDVPKKMGTSTGRAAIPHSAATALWYGYRPLRHMNRSWDRPGPGGGRDLKGGGASIIQRA